MQYKTTKNTLNSFIGLTVVYASYQIQLSLW